MCNKMIRYNSQINPQKKATKVSEFFPDKKMIEKQSKIRGGIIGIIFYFADDR
jgi:hypothetical protein